MKSLTALLIFGATLVMAKPVTDPIEARGKTLGVILNSPQHPTETKCILYILILCRTVQSFTIRQLCPKTILQQWKLEAKPLVYVAIRLFDPCQYPLHVFGSDPVLTEWPGYLLSRCGSRGPR